MKRVMQPELERLSMDCWCSYCDAAPGVDCTNQQNRWAALKHPHPERIAAARKLKKAKAGK
jgi:hypothetical protein